MKAIRENEDFLDDDLAYAAMAIENNPSCASMYLHLGTKGAHTLYIGCQMKKVKEK